MEGRRPERHITDPRNNSIQETSRRQRRTEASSEGGQGPDGAVAPCMEWNPESFSRFAHSSIIDSLA